MAGRWPQRSGRPHTLRVLVACCPVGQLPVRLGHSWCAVSSVVNKIVLSSQIIQRWDMGATPAPRLCLWHGASLPSQDRSRNPGECASMNSCWIQAPAQPPPGAGMAASQLTHPNPGTLSSSSAISRPAFVESFLSPLPWHPHGGSDCHIRPLLLDSALLSVLFRPAF